MTTRIFVSCDSAAISVGAEAVATAVENEIATRKLDAKLVRNGSRGMLWLEPLLEVETPEGRVGYGPVTPADVKAKFKLLVKRHHPDANGGDRACEDRLREIIQAYNYLKSVGYR